jgi:Ca2+-binding RTX toxin-like protein
MATFNIFRNSPNLTQSNKPGQFVDSPPQVMLYGSLTEFGLKNADGTTTFVTGTGFTYDWSGTGLVTGGIVTGMIHYDALGNLIDQIKGLNVVANTIAVQGIVAFPNFAQTTTLGFDFAAVFAGDDIINARVRTGNAIVNDDLNGYAGNDTIYAGTGDDIARGGDGNDTVFGDDGNDSLYGDAGNDVINGGNGNDYLVGGTGIDKLDGGAGNDILVDGSALSENDTLWGGAGNDVLMGSGGNDSIDGGSGIDSAAYLSLFSNLKVSLAPGGLSVVSATEGTDSLYSVERISALDGTYGWNATGTAWIKLSNVSSLVATASADQTFQGTALADTVSVSNAKSVYMLGAGDDTITAIGVGQSIYIDAGAGNDTINLGVQSQAPNYGTATAVIHGGDGNDTIQGGSGNDILSGDAGADTFVFNRLYSGYQNGTSTFHSPGADTITDFMVGSDHLHIGGQNISLADTAAGLLVTAYYVAAEGMGVPPNAPLTSGTILLEGVHGNILLADLLI